MTPRQEKFLQRRLAFAEFIKLYPLTTDDLDGEEWRDIEGYDGYQVSSFGRVKSFLHNTPRILKPRIINNEYLVAVLVKSGKEKSFSVHRLVAIAFIPNPDNKPQVNHIDGCKLNACLSNLEWATPSENGKHAFNTGLSKNARGGDDSQSKLTNEQARYVRDNPENLTTNKLAERFGVSRSIIIKIQRGQSYKDAGGAIKTQWKKIKYTPRVSDEIRAQIQAEYRGGDKNFGAIALAKKYGVTRKTVERIASEGYQTAEEKQSHLRFVADEIRAQIRAEYVKRDKERGATALAKKYGCSDTTIRNIVNEK